MRGMLGVWEGVPKVMANWGGGQFQSNINVRAMPEHCKYAQMIIIINVIITNLNFGDSPLAPLAPLCSGLWFGQETRQSHFDLSSET